MPDRDRPVGQVQQLEPVGQPAGDLLDGKHPDPGGGQLDPERQPVERAADPGHPGQVRDRQREPRLGRGRPVNEQPERVGVSDRLGPDRLGRRPKAPAGGAGSAASESGGTCQTVSAATRSGSRLVAITRRPGRAGQQPLADLAHMPRSGARRYQGTAAAAGAARRRPASPVAGGQVPRSPRSPRRSWRRPGRAGAGRPVRRTRHHPDNRAPAADDSHCQPRLADSAGPHSVSARVPAARARSSPSSRSRPIKAVNSVPTMPGPVSP